MITSNRIVKLDIARTFAILCVVLCHCSEMIYTQQSVKVAELGISSRIFMFGTFTIGRLGVPIFLYLSGILLLKKTIDSDEDIFKFYKNNLFPLFPCLVKNAPIYVSPATNHAKHYVPDGQSRIAHVKGCLLPKSFFYSAKYNACIGMHHNACITVHGSDDTTENS